MSGVRRPTVLFDCLSELTGGTMVLTSNRKNSRRRHRNENKANNNNNNNSKKLNAASSSNGNASNSGTGPRDDIAAGDKPDQNQKILNKRKFTTNTNHVERRAFKRNNKAFPDISKHHQTYAENTENAENVENKAAACLTPTKLINRLNLTDERKGESEGKPIVLGVRSPHPQPSAVVPTNTANKYRDARKALGNCGMKTMIGRDEQMNELFAFFRKHWLSKTSASLFASGQSGTGKTASLNLLLRSREFCTSYIRRIYVNCNGMNSSEAVLKKLCMEFSVKATGRQQLDYETPIQNYLKRTNKMTVIILDEIDELCSVKQSILYTIFEWAAIPRIHVIIVGIANSMELVERVIKRLNSRQLKPKHIHFMAYDKQEIIEIFNFSLAQADALDIFPLAAIQALAGKVTAINGDARQALNIGQRALELAEQHNKSNGAENEAPVSIGQVIEVLNKVYGTVQKLKYDLENDFPLQQKLVIGTIILMQRNERNKHICVGRLMEVYRRVCQKRQIQSLDPNEFQNLIYSVEARGILHIIRNKKLRYSKIELLWDEEEVNDMLGDKPLISSILNDPICITK